jgi:hypothetical protein
MEGRVATASLSELDRAYAGAVAAYQAGDYPRASRTLRAVIEDLERLPPAEEVFAQWSRAMLRLARSEGSQGRKGDAREVMERLLLADASVSPDPELYPPSFARQLDEVRIELRARPRRKLAVNAGGRPARVFVEGRFVGQAPVTLELAPAVYRVSATLGDARSATLAVDLSQEDQTAALDLSLAEMLRPNAGPGLAVAAAKRAGTVVTAGAALQLDRIFAVTLAADGDVRYLVGSVYDVPKGMLGREGRVRLSGATPPPEALGALASFLVTGEASSLVITRPVPNLKADPAVATRPRLPMAAGSRSREVLRWSPVATGALAVVLGGVATWQALESNSAYDDARGMLQPNGTLPIGADPNRYNGLLADGDSARRNAWIAGTGAATALGATAVLSYFSYKRTGEIGPFRF